MWGDSRSSVMPRHTVCCLLSSMLVAALPAPAICADGQADSGKQVIQSVSPGVPVSSPSQSLKLTDAQRARIQQVLAGQDTEVSFELKATKDAKSFEPKVDAKLPKGVKAEAFPQPLNTEIPQVRNFGYVKFKDDILIVDQMTNKIVDLFAQKG
jgi:hypothetical protein